MADLRKQGYTVTRNAGSHGAWDVLAMNADGVRLIQVKQQGAVDEEARSKLLAIPAPECASREIWERQPKGWKVELVGE